MASDVHFDSVLNVEIRENDAAVIESQEELIPYITIVLALSFDCQLRLILLDKCSLTNFKLFYSHLSMCVGIKKSPLKNKGLTSVASLRMVKYYKSVLHLTFRKFQMGQLKLDCYESYMVGLPNVRKVSCMWVNLKTGTMNTSTRRYNVFCIKVLVFGRLDQIFV